jgi:hypothetical protein
MHRADPASLRPASGEQGALRVAIYDDMGVLKQRLDTCRPEAEGDLVGQTPLETLLERMWYVECHLSSASRSPAEAARHFFK